MKNQKDCFHRNLVDIKAFIISNDKTLDDLRSNLMHSDDAFKPKFYTIDFTRRNKVKLENVRKRYKGIFLKEIPKRNKYKKGTVNLTVFEGVEVSPSESYTKNVSDSFDSEDRLTDSTSKVSTSNFTSASQLGSVSSVHIDFQLPLKSLHLNSEVKSDFTHVSHPNASYDFHRMTLSPSVLQKAVEKLKSKNSNQFEFLRNEVLNLFQRSKSESQINRMDRVKNIILENVHMSYLDEESDEESSLEELFCESDDNEDDETKLALLYSKMYVVKCRKEKSRNFSGNFLKISWFVSKDERQCFGNIDGIAKEEELPFFSHELTSQRESLLALSHMYDLKKLFGVNTDDSTSSQRKFEIKVEELNKSQRSESIFLPHVVNNPEMNND